MGNAELLVAGELIPLWIKILYTLFLCVLVPVYWIHWGPRNFLWFSDIALLATAIALWLESALLASMMTLAIALPELAWNADFFGRLVTGRHILGLSDYMFDGRKPLFLRALSLFHVVLPALLLWAVHRLGYEPRALAFQTVAALVILPVTYALTDPADNINWVYGPGRKPQTWTSPRAYLALVMLFFPVVIYLPTHLLLSALSGRP
ncbi:MAG: membrane-associated protein [Candidatus Rokuibacteriota bacterium]|nr:MAG: membrane-associated protein [Candidatus Rokubacteria bacterium]